MISSQLSQMKTRRTYSLMWFTFYFPPPSNISSGAILGQKSIASTGVIRLIGFAIQSLAWPHPRSDIETKGVTDGTRTTILALVPLLLSPWLQRRGKSLLQLNAMCWLKVVVTSVVIFNAFTETLLFKVTSTNIRVTVPDSSQAATHHFLGPSSVSTISSEEIGWRLSELSSSIDPSGKNRIVAFIFNN